MPSPPFRGLQAPNSLLQRRRTQIRLAQRAYRNRKENAIQTLEQKVQDLKDTNEEMSNVFMQLHDFAMTTGALDRNPELGRQLRLTTERFLALARKASEDGSSGKDDDGGGHASPSSHHAAVSPHRISTSPEAIDIPRSEPPPLLWGGYTVTHEPTPFLPDPPANTYEIITQPTPENASFPFGTPSFSFPLASLPPPTTYTPHESTFGRRLHRFATERALYLISMPDPPPARFHRVFGFCLLLETREAIHARTRRTVHKSIQESLAYWPYPFHHLGGAGAHQFDAGSDGGVRYGNQGTVDVMKPAQTNGGFGAGPFTAGVGATRELLDGEMRMGVEGFGGEFFDPEEVELYLRIRGVVIPGGVDEVTAVVDLDGFGGGVVGMGSSGTASEEESSSSVDGGTTATGSSGWDFGGTSLLDPLLGGGMFSQPAAPTTTDFMGFSTTAPAPEKRATVVVDVNMLISSMLSPPLDRRGGFWKLTVMQK